MSDQNAKEEMKRTEVYTSKCIVKLVDNMMDSIGIITSDEDIVNENK